MILGLVICTGLVNEFLLILAELSFTVGQIVLLLGVGCPSSQAGVGNPCMVPKLRMLFIVLKSCKIKDRRRICDRDHIWPLKPVPLQKYPWSKAKGVDWAMFLSSFNRQQQGSKREWKHTGFLQLTFESGTVFLLLYSVGQSKSQVG